MIFLVLGAELCPILCPLPTSYAKALTPQYLRMWYMTLYGDTAVKKVFRLNDAKLVGPNPI